MSMVEMEGYLAGVADSDLFGSLALLCLVLLLTALHRGMRQSRLHRTLMFVALASIVAIQVAGSYYGNLDPA
ncbi:hypothetical protein EI534_09410 [Pseudomonas frederiksbergensis]|uniref:hypothetical protein n=1 Tax=Pseudomonas sp. GM79 TaxID=1144338 RepID=UPI00026FB089|nr:hypothetical protein [Pseudomonas sp. GM79]EJN20570.1 hypothetical protein PMI36_04036 [Pseudomonas sp. GM79]MCE6977603.1 hypothetical protein [Pseudomonas frederiksbergensis]